MGAETLCYLSLHDLSGRIRRGDVSPVEAVEAFLQRIEQLNPRLSAFLTLCADRALEEAKRAGAEIAAGRWRGPLHGVPFGLRHGLYEPSTSMIRSRSAPAASDRPPP